VIAPSSWGHVRRVALGAALLVAGACASAAPAPPASPAPELAAPARGIPADLDVALRVDLVQLRRGLGDAAASALELQITDAARDPAGDRLLRDALARADVLWIAFRPGLARHSTDNVVILRGDFADIRVRDYPGDNRWQAPVDLGADLRRHDRSKPPHRSAPARVYALSTHLLMLVSEAEIDSVERRIERRADDPRVEPPERGTVSVAARVQPLLPLVERASPAVARLLAEAHRLEAHLSLDSVGLRGSAEVRFNDLDSADRARRALETLVELGRGEAGPVGKASRGLSVRTVGESLVLDLRLDANETASLLACATLGEGC
jgi:hypothetical protein